MLFPICIEHMHTYTVTFYNKNIKKNRKYKFKGEIYYIGEGLKYEKFQTVRKNM